MLGLVDCVLAMLTCVAFTGFVLCCVVSLFGVCDKLDLLLLFGFC